ncbi:distal tail protein Dit [Clostridium sp. BL-8]|uniref:distal tail protein Dit n=1 Tax=Clostridium sp. BL-8 TaxID=349938 RepID=UPI00098CEF72|nr:distal tail protein Dit [Clostridium sp. BL-8]OOM75503.1 phage tail protein [Clostridium sp. BL-8]
MYRMYFNLKYNTDLNFSIIKRPSIPSSEKSYTEIPIKGRDGKLYKEDNLQDIEFTVECNFVSKNADVWQEQYRKIKRWINNIKDVRLNFSDDKGYYYKVCKASIDSLSRIYKRLGKFNIKFTVDPYQYINNNEELILNAAMYNNWDVCQPAYRIVGNGKCILNINGNIVTCTVNSQLTIDTQFDKILESDGTYAIGKTDIKEMQDLYLQEEENTFSWTNGFTIYITPNWRTV